MNIIYFENLKNCPYYEPSYKRPGTYFSVEIEDMKFEANYESFEDGVVHIVRAGNRLRFYHWIHAYAVYLYFKKQGKQVKKYHFELGNQVHDITEQDILKKEKRILSEIIDLKFMYKDPGSHCRFCKIKQECHKELLDSGNLIVVPSISERVLKDFEVMNVDPLEVIKTDKIDKFRPFQRKSLYNLKSVYENTPLKLRKVKLPEKYIIFDVETYHENDFLFGYLLDDQYIPFIFESKEDDHKYLEMIEFLEKKERILIHYDVHDVQSLRKVAEIKPELKKRIEKILKNSIDLYEIIIKNYSFPVTSYSLKDISKYFGFHWRTDLNGYAVILEYKRYLKGEQGIMKSILDYNEDDCRATKLVMEKMKTI